MANQKQASARRPKMAERAQRQMDVLFPNIPPELIWMRGRNDGFSTVPRTLPIAMQAIDNQTKGTPAGHTLFCLWARSPDHPLVTIENPNTFASEAGFHGERAVHTWRKKMKILADLNFLLPKNGPSGDYHYVLLTNPNAAVEWMWSQNKVQDQLYARFIDRVTEIGAYGDIQNFHAYRERQKAEQANEVPAPPAPSGRQEQA